MDDEKKAAIGLIGLAVMGRNFALNIAEKGNTISVYNRSTEKTDIAVEEAKKDGINNLTGYYSIQEFIQSLSKPRSIVILIKAGPAVDATIDTLLENGLEKDDLIIDGGNEWYENTERRAARLAESGILYMGMGISGGEEGARYGPSLMPGGPRDAYSRVEAILTKCAAQVDGQECVTYIGPGGAGNYVKMVHNGIEYGDMQLIAEAYDLLKHVAGLSNDRLHEIFAEWNNGELQSFLIEITARIFQKKDDMDPEKQAYLVDKVLDKTGSKGTGKWTCQDAAEQGVSVSTMAAALDARYLSSVKEERESASAILSGPDSVPAYPEEKDIGQFIEDVRAALYASKICSYAQGMKLIQTVGQQKGWDLNLGMIATIWKGGCIIRAVFLDRIKRAYEVQPDLQNLLVSEEFSGDLKDRQAQWRSVVATAVRHGVPIPAMSASLAYYDSYRRQNLPANLTQAQRDFFGAHTYYRNDGLVAEAVHSEWGKD